MTTATVPGAREVADRQLAAYNAHDLEAFCGLFAADAELSDLLTGDVFARGIDEIRERYRERFATGGLRCDVHARIDLGEVAIDQETVFGLPGGTVEMVAVYEVRDGLIRTVRFPPVGGAGPTASTGPDDASHNHGSQRPHPVRDRCWAGMAQTEEQSSAVYS